VATGEAEGPTPPSVIRLIAGQRVSASLVGEKAFHKRGTRRLRAGRRNKRAQVRNLEQYYRLGSGVKR